MTKVNANGISIEVESYGALDAPTVLLIMGLGAQLTLWPIELVDALVARGFRVVRFDNRDIGLSTKFDSAGIPDMPSLMMALDENCQLQARLSVETRTSAYQVRTGNFSESPITVYFTIRQFWGKQAFKSFHESYRNQRRLLDELVASHLIPGVITPLQRAIAAKQ